MIGFYVGSNISFLSRFLLSLRHQERWCFFVWIRYLHRVG